MMDILGTYSLMAHSVEEEVARDCICFSEPDAVVVVCVATCLERNMNLVLQTDELELCGAFYPSFNRTLCGVKFGIHSLPFMHIAILVLFSHSLAHNRNISKINIKAAFEFFRITKYAIPISKESIVIIIPLMIP